MVPEWMTWVFNDIVIFIIEMASFMAALGVLYKVFIKKHADKAKDVINTWPSVVEGATEIKDVKEVVNRIEPMVDKLEEKRIEDEIAEPLVKKARLFSLKQAMYNEKLPHSERIDAGRAYVAYGGNGAGKLYLEEILMPELIERLRIKNGCVERSQDGREG